MWRPWLGFLLVAMIALAGADRSMAAEAKPEPARPTILVVGDSLSAGYGIDVSAGWVALLQRRLGQEGYGYRVVNASASGETTGGARARFARLLEIHRPRIVILELGGNDGLRALPLAQVRANLAAMMDQARDAGAEVLLVGMQIPPNYGAEYADRFRDMYGDLAREHGVPLVEFFLEGVALDPSLMLDDGIHPNAAAQPTLLENVWPRLRAMLQATPP